MLEYNDKEFLFGAIAHHVDSCMWQEEDEANELDDRDEPADGHEFEHHVARILKDNGWSVYHTGKSGDQGADIIAEKESRKYAVAKVMGWKMVFPEEISAAELEDNGPSGSALSLLIRSTLVRTNDSHTAVQLKLLLYGHLEITVGQHEVYDLPFT